MRARRCRPSRAGIGIEGARERVPRHGADDDGRVRRSRRATATCGDAVRRRTTMRASAFVTHLAAARGDATRPPASRRARRAARAGSAIAASRRVPPNICASTRTNGGAAAVAIGWFSAATASGSHSSSISRGVCPWRRSHASTVSSARAAVNGRPLARSACARRITGPSRSAASAIEDRERRPSRQARRRRCHGGGSAAVRRRLRRAVALHELDLEVVVDLDQRARCRWCAGTGTSRGSSR